MAPPQTTRKRSGGPGPGSGPGRGAGAREIPDKLYFRIGEVAKLCGVPAYVLRFWETEFPQLKPNKGGTGQRLYRRRDVETALRVKTLLYDEGYTIAGARGAFRAEARAAGGSPAATGSAELPAAPGPAASGDAAGRTAAETPAAVADAAASASAAPVTTSVDAQAAPQGGVARALPADTRPLLALQRDLRELHALLSKPIAGRGAVQAIRAARPASAPASVTAQPVPIPFARPHLLNPSRPALPPNRGLFDEADTPPGEH